MTYPSCACKIEDRGLLGIRVELCEECKVASKTTQHQKSILYLVGLGFNLDYASCSRIREQLLETMKLRVASPTASVSVSCVDPSTPLEPVAD